MDKIIPFTLKRANENATVRILHSNTNTMPRDKIHWVDGFGGKKKCFKCLGEGCTMCAAGINAQEKLYIKLYDYTDNTVKIWSRTPNQKFIAQLDEIVNDWGALNECVVKITRDSDEFPTYSTAIQPATKFAVPSEPIDENFGYRMCTKRSAEDINKFITTGELPPKPASNYLPKDEYIAKMKAEKEAQSYSSTPSAAPTPSYAKKEESYKATPEPVHEPAEEDSDLPF